MKLKRITLDEAITYFDEQTPNQYSREEKIRWLSELDERIYRGIITRRIPRMYPVRQITSEDVGEDREVHFTLFDYNSHLGVGTQLSTDAIETFFVFQPTEGDIGKWYGRYDFDGYNDETDGETVLIAPAMFGDMYRYFLEWKVDVNNREMGAANNAMALYQAYYDDYYTFINENYRVADRRRISIY